MSDETPQNCFCGGQRPNWEYHHPDGCASKELADDLAHNDGGRVA